MEYKSAIKKKNEILSFSMTWIDLEGIMLNERTQTEKDKDCILSLICGYINITKKNKNHRYRKLVVTIKVREDGRGKTEAEIKRYKLLCIK